MNKKIGFIGLVCKFKGDNILDFWFQNSGLLLANLFFSSSSNLVYHARFLKLVSGSSGPFVCLWLFQLFARKLSEKMFIFEKMVWNKDIEF